jgi:HSP20 family molecular chaperone IbpA
VLTVSGKREATEARAMSASSGASAATAPSRAPHAAVGVDPKKIKATTHDGVLEVTIPLPKEVAQEPITITPTAA